MSLYRCAMCGSNKIVLETKQEGYDTKKGIWGAVLFGGIGALAGTSGKTVTYYHCGDCGQVLNRTMMSVEKDSIDRCLDNPDIYESSLKKYKERYRNIEWEEPVNDSVRIQLQVSDIEEYIIEYMKRMGVPVTMEQLKEQLRDIAENIFNVGYAIENLEKKGILKSEKIASEYCYILVTDIEEVKELALKNAASEKAKELVRSKNYITILQEILQNSSMTWEEIYNYLKENNYLSKEVLKKEKENSYIPLYFTKALIRKLRTADIGSRTRINPIVIENDRYRIKTTTEIKDCKVSAQHNANAEISKEIDSLKSIIETLQNAGKPMSCNELIEMNQDLKSRIFQQVNAKLIQLEKAGIIKSKLLKKRNCYFMENNSKAEIDKKLYEVVENKTVRGFLD